MVHNFDERIERRDTDSKKYSLDYFPEDVQPMWIADTDFRCPEPVVKRMRERAEHGIYGYPCDQAEFSKAACGWLHRRFDFLTDEGNIFYIPGVIPGIICALRAFSNPGDKVVLQTPAYPPFRNLIVNNGRQLYENQLKLSEGRYEIDFEDLQKKLSDSRTSVMILCNPHNPTGRVFSLEELKRIIALCKENNVFLISDEIHCDLTYYHKRHHLLFSAGGEVEKFAAVFMNPSKTFNIAGLRTAAVVAPDSNVRERIVRELENCKGYGRNVFGIAAFIAAYTDCDYYADQLMDYLEGNLEYLRKELEHIPEITMIEPEATYLIWLDCRNLGMKHRDLVDFFCNTAKVGLNDGLTFGKEGEGFMRLNIACPRVYLEEGLNRIREAIFHGRH